MDHCTGVNNKGNVTIFIDPTPIRPNGYRLQGRDLTVLKDTTKIGTYTLDDIAFDAASSRPDRKILVVELDTANDVVRSTSVPNVAPPT